MTNIPDLQSEYILEGKVGKGKDGNVLKVRLKKNNDKFHAVKEFEKDLKDPDKEKSFFAEVELLKEINNPAILPFIGFSLHNNLDSEFQDHPALVFDFIPYTLVNLINGSLPKSKKYIILLGIAQAMKYLHSKHIVHRDLKPSNVLIDNNYYPFVCDFGESKKFEGNIDDFMLETFTGSMMYMAPEIPLGKYSPYVDVYSYSILFYHVITEKVPYQNIKNMFEFFKELQKGKRPNLDIVEDDEIKDFLKKCWSNDISERMSFDKIVDMLKKKSFRQFFDVKDDEVILYLMRFNDILPDYGVKEIIKQAKDMLKDGKVNEALRYFKNAAETGDAKAMYLYAQFLIKNFEEEQYLVEANKYYQSSADKGYKKAMYSYSGFLCSHQDVIQNPEWPKYAKIAADMGDYYAMNDYACFCSKGKGVPKNLTEATRYFEKSIENGFYNAAYNYAAILEEENDIATHKNAIFYYYKLAADHGVDKAKKRLKYLQSKYKK